MTETAAWPRFDRRLLVAAAIGVLLVAFIMLLKTTSSGSGDQVTLGAAVQPQPTRTTTTTVAVPPAPTQVLDSLLDPFAQVVVAPAASQSVLAVPSPVAAGTAQTTVAQSTTTTTRATTTTARPANRASAPATTTATTAPASATQSPPPTFPANTVAGTAGPVAVPGTALALCVHTATSTSALTCTDTPAATAVSLTALATIAPGAVTPPTITTGVCSNGQGVALVVASGSSETTITGAATMIVGGSPIVIPINLAPTPPSQTALISACVPPGVGTPAVPGPPAPSQLGTLVGGFFQLLVGLLSAVPTGATPAP